jgi:hypothetical protein
MYCASIGLRSIVDVLRPSIGLRPIVDVLRPSIGLRSFADVLRPSIGLRPIVDVLRPSIGLHPIADVLRPFRAGLSLTYYAPSGLVMKGWDGINGLKRKSTSTPFFLGRECNRSLGRWFLRQQRRPKGLEFHVAKK